eukprot:450677_1
MGTCCIPPNSDELEAVVNCFKNNQPLTKLPSIPFVGRIQYEPYNGYLTKTARSFAFISGEDGIQKMSKFKDDVDKCIAVGFSHAWINSQCDKNRKFRLLLFPKQSDNYEAINCTWQNIFNLFEQQYANNIYPRIHPFMNDLKSKTFKQITQDCSLNFNDIEENGEADPNYMTFDRFVKIPVNKVTLIDVRLFLFCWLHFNELFDGDGYAYDHHGTRGSKEYIIPNIKLNTISNLHIVDLDVQIKY